MFVLRIRQNNPSPWSAAVSQTSRSNVWKQIRFTFLQPLCEGVTAATGFQHSRAPSVLDTLERLLHFIVSGSMLA